MLLDGEDDAMKPTTEAEGTEGAEATDAHAGHDHSAMPAEHTEEHAA